MPLGGLTWGQGDKSPAASLNWWFDHPTGNLHLELPLIFTVFERKIQFPRQVCSVVTWRVLLTSSRGEEVQGRVRNPIQGCGLSCPLVNSWERGSAPHTPQLPTPKPGVKNVLLLSLPAASCAKDICREHSSFSHVKPFTEVQRGPGEAPLAWL